MTAVTVPPPAGTAARLVRSGALFGAGIVAAYGLNALFQVGIARILDPAEFSLLAILFALILVVSVPAVAIQAAVARDVARHLAAGDRGAAAGTVLGTARAVLRVALAGLLLGGALCVPLAYLTDVRRPLPLVGTALVILLVLELAVVWGALQGARRFGLLSLGQLAGSGLKVALGFGAAALGTGVAGIMFGLALGTAVTLALFALPLRPVLGAYGGRGVAAVPRQLARDSWGLVLSLSLFALVTSADLLVARLSFPARTAGLYAAASVAARALLLVPNAVTTVLFPHVATLNDRLRERRHLLGGLTATTAVGGLLVLLFAVVPHTLLRLTFGGSYDGASRWLAPLGLAMLLYSLVNVYLFHFLSIGRNRYPLLAAPVFVAQVCSYAVFHDRPAQLVATQVVGAAVLLGAGELYDRFAPH